MRNPLQVALDFAVARSQEAEALFKEWAPRVRDPEVQALFAQLAAGERGRVEMLSRMIPEELAPPGGETFGLTDLLVHPKTVRHPTLEKTVRLAIRHKEVSASLYERIAGFDGEACSFFRAMADADRRAMRALEAYADRLTEGEASLTPPQ